MNSDKPYICGVDMVSPLGVDPDEQWNNAWAGQSGIGPLTRFPLRDGFPVTISGEVPDFDLSPYPFLRPRCMAHWSSPIFKHGLLVAYRALKKAGIEITPEIANRTAVTFSTAIGGLDAVVEADRKMEATGKLPHPFVNPNSCVNMAAGKVSILTGATGPTATTVTACATGNTSVIIGSLFIRNNSADVAICGAVDFPLVEPIVAGFAAMKGAYTTKKSAEPEPPEHASRPFSMGRRGFVVSEGAACIVLASERFVKTWGLKPSFQVAGWATNSDAHHYVAPNLDTVTACMKEAVADASITPDDIHSINAHAASTKIGDQVEAEAIKKVFRGRIPPITANKSLIGHAMGASSAIETVLAVEGMQRDSLLPTINHNPDPALDLESVVSEPIRLEQEHVLHNAFGFGGCNACLVLRRLR